MDRQLQIVLRLQDQASKELRRITGELDGVQASTNRFGGALDYVAGMAKTAALALGAAAVAGVSYGVNIAAQLETAQVGLATLLGSTEKANATVQRLKKEAARTPFELPGLTQAVQLLTSVTKDGDKSIDIILDIGEGLAAMGKGQVELDRIIVNLQQIAAVGRAATIDIKQFAFAGIPIYEMLTEQTGLAGQALAEFIENGGVTFELLATMFDKANDAGGRFFNAFVNQSGTFNQVWSNMKDSIGIALADFVIWIGLFGGLKAAMTDVTFVFTNYRQILADTHEAVAAFLATLEAHTGIVAAFREAWATLSDTWVTSVQPALSELWIALQPLLPFIQMLGEAIGTLLGAAVIHAIRVIGQWITMTAELLSILMQASSWIVSYLTPSIKAIGDAVSFVVDKVEALINAFSRLSGAKSAMAGFGGAAMGALGSFGLPIPFANGGIVTRPTLGLVGEAGPEAIIPLSKMSGMGGGITVNIYGDVSGNEVVEKVKEALMGSLRSDSRFAI
jgi:tape measure domain-containing protein